MYNEIAALQQEFNLKKTQVENTVKLIDEGNTIPFIARYRKEMTGSLDDQVLRELYDRLMYLRSLNEKCEQTKKLIDEQGQLTDEIAAALDNAKTLSEIEDIYRPFRPKRRTRATVAKEKGLQPLADFIMLQLTDDDILKEAEKYIDPEKQVETAQQALEGASDIIAESISDNADYRKIIRKLTFDKGVLEVKAADPEAQSVYEMYYDFHEPVKKIAGHRVLAVNRGEKEGVLSVRLEAPVEDIYNKLKKELIFSKRADVIDFLTNALDDSYKRLIAPSIEREIRNDLTEKAEEQAAVEEPIEELKEEIEEQVETAEEEVRETVEEPVREIEETVEEIEAEAETAAETVTETAAEAETEAETETEAAAKTETEIVAETVIPKIETFE